MSLFAIVSCVLITISVVDCKCGLTPYIVNGTDAEISEVPFQVSMRLAEDGHHFCGASILNSMWILTAGHCIKEKGPRDITVQYGVTTITSTGPNIMRVSKIVVHPSFKFGRTARAVKLPKRFQPTRTGVRAILAGWGRNATNGVPQKHLKKVELTILPKTVCQLFYPNEFHITNLCAGPKEGIRGQCKGDSGGALISNDVQVGIVSWCDRPCGTKPGIFTEVSNYVDWIEGTLRKG